MKEQNAAESESGPDSLIEFLARETARHIQEGRDREASWAGTRAERRARLREMWPDDDDDDDDAPSIQEEVKELLQEEQRPFWGVPALAVAVKE